MADREHSKDKLLEDTHPFRTNAAAIIKEMKELNDSCQGRAKLLVDEILHSIFFLGKINKPPFSPERLVNDDTRFKELKEQFPLPFELYSSQLPKRSPFSCVLDMIVFLEEQEKERRVKEGQEKERQEKERQEKERQEKERQEKEGQKKERQEKGRQEKERQEKGRQEKEGQKKERQEKERQKKEIQEKERQEKEGQKKEGQKKEDAIIRKLQEIIKPLNQKHLVSAAICVSKVKKNPNSACRYYGVSMSRMLPVSRRIMISASCLEYWDSYVAGAVMTYHPKLTKHTGFDGTITLPKKVSCKTFNLFAGGKGTMPPCTSCQNLFALKPEPYPYGNCAEAESVSNLFKNDTVREQARPNPEKFTDGNRIEAIQIAMAYLTEKLPEGFTRDIQFYNPQL